MPKPLTDSLTWGGCLDGSLATYAWWDRSYDHNDPGIAPDCTGQR